MVAVASCPPRAPSCTSRRPPPTSYTTVSNVVLAAGVAVTSCPPPQYHQIADIYPLLPSLPYTTLCLLPHCSIIIYPTDARRRLYAVLQLRLNFLPSLLCCHPEAPTSTRTCPPPPISTTVTYDVRVPVVAPFPRTIIKSHLSTAASIHCFLVHYAWYRRCRVLVPLPSHHHLIAFVHRNMYTLLSFPLCMLPSLPCRGPPSLAPSANRTRPPPPVYAVVPYAVLADAVAVSWTAFRCTIIYLQSCTAASIHCFP